MCVKISTMKFLWMAFVLLFIAQINVVRSDDDSSESGESKSNEIKSIEGLTEQNDTKSFDKAKKFVVTIKPPNNTPYVIPKRSEKKPFIPKFQLSKLVPTGNAETSPILTTKRPNLMKTRKFTSKPHVHDGTRTLLEIHNFNKEKTPRKFNKHSTEENVEKKHFKHNDLKNSEDRFQHFTNVDDSSEEDSEESRKNAVAASKRKFMKGAASNKIQSVVPLPTKPTVTRHYKIKDLLKNQTIVPRMEMKRIVPVVIQMVKKPVSFENKYKRTTIRTTLVEAVSKANVEATTKTNVDADSEKADQKEFIFLKNQNQKRNVSLEEEEVVTTDPINAADRPKRSINIIEEEHKVPTKTSFVKPKASDWPMLSVFTYNNINA